MLGSLRCRRWLHHLDSLWQHLRLRASASLLDQREGSLHRPIRHVVHQCRHQYLDRLRHNSPSHASHPASAARKTTEVGSDRHLRCRRLVCATFSHTPHPLTLSSVCIVSILRLQSLVAISNSTDQSYDNPAAATWSSVETNVGIICSCLPLLRPLMTKCLPGVFSSNKRNTHSTPRVYPTIGSARSRPLPSHNGDGDYALATTTKGGSGRGSSESTGRDIQVETRIDVKVESGEGEGRFLSGWETPRSKGARSSTETLVKDPRDVV